MNSKMNILKALGIILVVVGHTNGLVFPWFPPYSFHMPLFIFVSGYFYKTKYETGIKDFTVKKAKDLLIPYFKWNFIYGGFIFVLQFINLVEFGSPFNLYNLFIEPWKSGHQYLFNIAGWFVLMLFVIQVVYIGSRKLLTRYIRNEYALMGFYLLVGIVGTYLASHPVFNQYYYVNRMLVGLPFFQLGYLYKEKLEKIDRFNSITFTGLIVYQALIIFIYKYISMAMVWGNFGGHILLPFLSSISGIWLVMHLADLIDTKLKNDRLLNYIGQNTWTIMLHHLFIFWLINLGFYGAFKLGWITGFDVNLFKTDIYYKFASTDAYFIYVILGVLIPVGLKYVTERRKQKKLPLVKKLSA